MDKEVLRVPKISVKTCGFSAKELRKLVDGVNGTVFLLRIGGVAVEAFTGESSTGEWTGLRGLFTAVNKDGGAFHSTVAFLPASVTKKIADQLAQGVVEVEFAADIYISETDKNASGYSYQAEPILSENAAKKSEMISQRILGLKLPNALAITDKSKKKTA